MFWSQVPHRVYLEGHGDLVSRLITFITHIVTLNLPIINLLTKSPDPPSSIPHIDLKLISVSMHSTLQALFFGVRGFEGSPCCLECLEVLLEWLGRRA